LSLKGKVAVDRGDFALNCFLVTTGKERETKLLELVSDEGNGTGLILHIDMDGGHLPLDHAIVLILLFPEIGKVTFKFGNRVVDDTGPSVNGRGYTFTGKAS
jgi:hypothetical protein